MEERCIAWAGNAHSLVKVRCSSAAEDDHIPVGVVVAHDAAVAVGCSLAEELARNSAAHTAAELPAGHNRAAGPDRNLPVEQDIAAGSDWLERCKTLVVVNCSFDLLEAGIRTRLCCRRRNLQIPTTFSPAVHCQILLQRGKERAYP